jgi:aspartyl-tRNA(Asn)/glutamyl-tRNA(Gln) amidotransferase subunit C
VTISTGDVMHVARLAELEVPEAELPRLTEQLDRIVAYVGQLRELGVDASTPPFVPGPPAAPLRPDEVRPAALARPPAALAADFRDGFFVVPRLGAMEEE